MIAGPHNRAELDGTRWKAVLLGLRLANSHLGVFAFGCIYLLWGILLGVIVFLLLIPFALLDKMDAFGDVVGSIIFYGYVLPLVLIFASTWAVKLFARLLWCGVPEPVMATLLAFVSAAGRLCVLLAVGYLCLRGGPFGKGPLLPEVIVCSGIAWLGLVAEWGFIRTLRRHLNPIPDSAMLPAESNGTAEGSSGPDDVVNHTNGSPSKRDLGESPFKRDLGERFRSRFPRGHKFIAWILLPIAYVAFSSLADEGNFRAVPIAVVRLAIIAPVILQVFWIPSGGIDPLINALSERTSNENLHPR